LELDTKTRDVAKTYEGAKTPKKCNVTRIGNQLRSGVLYVGTAVGHLCKKYCAEKQLLD